MTTRAGTSSHKFSGTFDGSSYTISVSYSDNADYCAPFSYTDGATIRKLNVGGTITATHTHAAGLIGYAYGTTTITDCHSSVTINSNISGDGTHAGFIACTSTGSTTNITNCVFDGNIVSTNGKTTDSCGGFVGWKNNTVNISNCLLKANMSTIGSNDSYTFVRCGDGNVSIENSYYITALGTVQGTQAYTSRQSFPCKSTTILGNTVYYAADLTPFGKTDSYTPDGSTANPYIISTTEGWNYLCDALQDNDTWNRFSGKTVRLGADITVTRMAGSSGHDFKGTFDGNGKTLTVNYTATEKYAAPFRNAESGCVIENLHVTGTITTSAQNAAGIIGNQFGTVTIRNCRSSVTIQSSVSGDGTHGGFVAIKGNSNSASLTIEGCVFDGKIVSTGDDATTKCGGFVGWRKDNGSLTITNSLYAPQTDANAVTVGATFARNGGTISNCYYTEAFGTVQGAFACTATAAPANLGTAVTGVSYTVLTAYENGILFGGKYYVAPADVTLHDDQTNDLNGKNGYLADVTLTGRTLYKDGKWNTLCLPFDVKIAGSALDGDNVDVRTLSTASFSDGMLTLNFTDAGAVTTMEAGKPYIIKWAKPSGYENHESDFDIFDPVFSAVTVSSTTAGSVTSTDGKVQFVGCYSPVDIAAGNKATLYLGAANTLYWPNGSMTIGSCRAYFKVDLGNGLGIYPAPAEVRQFVLNFGDEDDATGILSTTNFTDFTNSDDAWYDLSGRKLSGKPSQRGVYIHGGRKIAVQ